MRSTIFAPPPSPERLSASGVRYSRDGCGRSWLSKAKDSVSPKEQLGQDCVAFEVDVRILDEAPQPLDFLTELAPRSAFASTEFHQAIAHGH